ncbi:hypothetical protein GJA_3114 [Janthinobacterium agaricidamnosum NBRC 102515 = DSM 9628]|uniref:Uncharacterized protein n=1 Tax=Janthinobacterium agaricidamnosum NBRC 102515 = DSM 9628 TaxID=1349767 RepID=W0V4I1_9BURK|nr:hypothetical protein GJA_3114 [Janthinobacterium agaricidamnosum NBRC 102515 = DSM 9628]
MGGQTYRTCIRIPDRKVASSMKFFSGESILQTNITNNLIINFIAIKSIVISDANHRG